MNLIQQLEAEQIAKLTEKRAIPEFRPGDTLKVGVRLARGAALTVVVLRYARQARRVVKVLHLSLPRLDWRRERVLGIP